MRAIFVGGPLHGELREVERPYVEAAVLLRPEVCPGDADPRELVQTQTVTYRRRTYSTGCGTAFYPFVRDGDRPDADEILDAVIRAGGIGVDHLCEREGVIA